MKNPSLHCVLILPLLLGCAETYRQPEKDTPSSWHFSSKDPDISTINDGKNIDPFWWKQFDDVTLNALMEKALSSNHDLFIAAARLEEAKASASYPSLFPTVSMTGNVLRRGSQSGLGGIDATDTLTSSGLLANWDVDLNGRLRHANRAKEAIAQRVEAEYKQTISSILAQTAASYLEVRYLQNLKTLILKNIAVQNETLRVTKRQQEAGAIGKLDSMRAESQLLHTEADIPKTDTLLVQAKNRLAVLLGQPPGAVDKLLEEKLPMPKIQKSLVLEAPASVVSKRPDIQVAEYLFKESVENQNVRTAEMFPNLSISSFFGLGGSSVYGASTPWGLGINVLGTLLDFGRIERQIDVAKTQKTQALLHYKKAVLLALEEVENALILYVNEKKSHEKYVRETTQRDKAVDLVRIQFNAGESDFLDVLNEEERLLEAQTASLRSSYKATAALISLYKAIGLVPFERQEIVDDKH